MRSVQRARGFTLLEVLVAFVILGVSMGLLLAMLSRGLGQVSRARDETEASLHAQSFLDALGVIEPVSPGQREGEFEGGRYRYQLRVEAIEDPTPAPKPVPGAPVPTDPVGGPTLYRVALVVEWGEGGPRQQLRYVTLRARTPSLLATSQ